MSKSKDIPFSRMQKISGSGVFVKGFGRYGRQSMKPYAHRDDYYMVALLTDGSAAVEVDFERIELHAGDILIISPWQVHGKPKDESWQADGWMLALSPEILTESDARIIEGYSISPHPVSPGESIINDIVGLCSMLERNLGCDAIASSLASAVKSFVISTLDSSAKEVSGRFRAITLSLSKLLDKYLISEKRGQAEKSPAVYASMLNISEVYLNEAVKGATGLSAGEYIRRRIIVEAKRKLTYSSMSAKEIAFALGYEDYAYFSKLFKKYAGKSPVEFRKNLK